MTWACLGASGMREPARMKRPEHERGILMAKVFRPSTREASILSKIESSKEHARRMSISAIPDCIEALSNAVTMKLVENQLVETTNKNGLQENIQQCLETLHRADDFDVDYKLSPFRQIVPHPHVVSLYLTAFVLEEVINLRDTVDVFGSDEDIYLTIHQQVSRFLP